MLVIDKDNIGCILKAVTPFVEHEDNDIRRVFLAAAVVAIAVLIGAFFLLSNTGKPKPVSEEESLEIALEYVRNSPTFRFDGIEGSLEHVETLYPDVPTPYTWEFVFTFECRHSGYGDRTGQMLLEVITPHIAHVVVQERKVVTATLDGKWDIIKQEMILSPTPEIIDFLVINVQVGRSPTPL